MQLQTTIQSLPLRWTLSTIELKKLSLEGQGWLPGSVHVKNKGTANAKFWKPENWYINKEEKPGSSLVLPGTEKRGEINEGLPVISTLCT